MPYYEVTIRVSMPVLVKAADEHEAEKIAEENCLGDFNRIEAECEHELDAVKDKDIIEEYKREGNFHFDEEVE